MSASKYYLKKLLIASILALITLTAGWGLFSLKPLAGHDAAAYPVNQAQFMANLREGVLFPRWSPDTRFGYGQPQLQFRPPLLHYIAVPIQAATGNPFLALHIALFFAVLMAGWGAYALVRLHLGQWPALVAAAGFVCANYMLANLYLRGAYYEVFASAAMPWILWAQSRENVLLRRTWLVGPVAWTALFMGHPAVAFFFFPLALVHALSEAFLSRRWCIFAFSSLYFVVGILLSAPYTLVMMSERSWVRMEIFLSNLDSWRRHFFSLGTWFTEKWPVTYTEYSGVDYLGRALHPEMRGLDFWAIVVLFISPLVWWLALRNCRLSTVDPGFAKSSAEASCQRSEKLFWAVFFYAAVWILFAFSLRMSLPVWNHVALMDTFNYPWRVLNVTCLCLALAAAHTVALLAEIMESKGYHLACVFLMALFIIAPLAEAFPHTAGWPGPKWLTRAALTPSAIRQHAGIPQQFYTPKWVRSYATQPALSDAQVVEGQAIVTIIERHPTKWRVRVEAASPARIALSHYYYPGWRIHGLNNKFVETEPWGEMGLISFVVPPGKHNIEARFGGTFARRMANVAFFAGLGIILLGALWPRRTPPPLSSGRNASAKPGQGGDSLSSPPSEGWLQAGVGSVIILVGAIILTEYLVNSRDEESLAIQASQQLSTGNNLAAIHSFARLLRERETDIAACYNLGAAYHNYGWYDEAFVHYDRVLSQANEYATKAAHSAARISLMRKDYERARRYYEEALRHQPNAKDIREEYNQLQVRNPNSEARNKFK
jgi:hypothetical protein